MYLMTPLTSHGAAGTTQTSQGVAGTTQTSHRVAGTTQTSHRVAETTRMVAACESTDTNGSLTQLDCSSDTTAELTHQQHDCGTRTDGAIWPAALGDAEMLVPCGAEVRQCCFAFVCFDESYSDIQSVALARVILHPSYMRRVACHSLMLLMLRSNCGS